MIGLSIAVIDDDGPFLWLMEELLADAGYQVHTLQSPAQALTALRALRPAAVLLDLRFGAELLGWTLLEAIRGDTTLARTPIVVCSADAEELHGRAAFLTTMHCASLDKPFDVDDLLGTLASVLLTGTDGGPQVSDRTEPAAVTAPPAAWSAGGAGARAPAFGVLPPATA